MADDIHSILIGIPTTIAQNVTWAAPARASRCYSQGGAAMEQSNDGSTWDAVTLDDDEGFECSSAFIRTTAASALVTFKVF